ncbi:MAG: hypothetical protein FJ149_12490 [Euryarchaeota archaeon]|nr:hypothetical protein [Euryarchaeota archaeon]
MSRKGERGAGGRQRWGNGQRAAVTKRDPSSTAPCRPLPAAFPITSPPAAEAAGCSPPAGPAASPRPPAAWPARRAFRARRAFPARPAWAGRRACAPWRRGPAS